MPLGFVKDAISLSGLTGTKLKCEVIGDYYNFWWGITSGGQSRGYRYPTSIVELDAATGEIYIKETEETVLGSAGHALELKTKNANTYNLKVVLVEKNIDCYNTLKRVIKRRWPSINIEDAERKDVSEHYNIYMSNSEFDAAIKTIKNIELGNSLFYFDPLRHVTFDSIETIAKGRLETFYKSGTEFLIFVFTSDWFLGRDDFSPLPKSTDESSWSIDEKSTVIDADSLFGNQDWREAALSEESITKREEAFVVQYKKSLHKWFRYVLPLPFNPKQDQIFHLILCSNYELGVRMTRDFYSEKTNNPRYTPNNNKTYKIFINLHPELRVGLRGNRRPPHWRILWNTVRNHEEGICDCYCPDFDNISNNIYVRQDCLSWLEKEGYLTKWYIENAWDNDIQQYILNWEKVTESLGVTSPQPLMPLSSQQSS